MMKTGAQIIVECLLEQGVDTVFGYPGGAVLNIYDALYEYQDRLRHVLTAHEQGASHAADGYARATGRTGVVIATSGPGATNLVTGLATAYMDSVPVVAITGNVSVDLLGRDSFQEVDITGITTPVTKHNFIVKRVEELADTLRQAFKIAGSGRKGPVLVDVPKDVTAAKTDYEPQQPAAIETEEPDEAEICRAVELLNKARRPLIYAGGGAVSADGAAALGDLARRGQIPVALSLMGQGAFPSDDPLCLGMIGMHGTWAANRASQECDLLLAAGARFSDRVAGNRERFAPRAKIIHLDVDPAEFRKNVRADLTVEGDLRKTLARLAAGISRKEKGWLEEIRSWPVPAIKDLGACRDDLSQPRQVIETAARLTDDPIVVTDVGQHQMWTAQCFPFYRPRRFLTSGGLGTMGFGMGAAIGAQTAFPDKQVVLFTGDGSFHMNMNELVTLASYNLPVTVIVMNNRVLGMVRQWQKVFYGSRFSATDPHRPTDYVKLAEAFGLSGLRLERAEDTEAVLQKALSARRPVVVDCRISPDANVLPMIPPGGTADDIMMEME